MCRVTDSCMLENGQGKHCESDLHLELRSLCYICTSLHCASFSVISTLSLFFFLLFENVSVGYDFVVLATLLDLALNYEHYVNLLLRAQNNGVFFWISGLWQFLLPLTCKQWVSHAVRSFSLQGRHGLFSPGHRINAYSVEYYLTPGNAVCVPSNFSYYLLFFLQIKQHTSHSWLLFHPIFFISFLIVLFKSFGSRLLFKVKNNPKKLLDFMCGDVSCCCSSSLSQFMTGLCLSCRQVFDIVLFWYWTPSPKKRKVRKC